LNGAYFSQLLLLMLLLMLLVLLLHTAPLACPCSIIAPTVASGVSRSTCPIKMIAMIVTIVSVLHLSRSVETDHARLVSHR
jgi:hypothetical protein